MTLTRLLCVLALAAGISGLALECHFARGTLPDNTKCLYQGIKKDLLAKTGEDALDVGRFFEADLLVVVGYSSLALLAFGWLRPSVPKWMALGALSLAFLGATVDLVGNFVCIRYACNVMAHGSASAPTSLMDKITLAKTTALKDSIYLFAPLCVWVLWRKISARL